jgi:hypothetical protein
VIAAGDRRHGEQGDQEAEDEGRDRREGHAAERSPELTSTWDGRVTGELRWESGAGDGNRTRMASLEGWGSAIELHPRAPARGAGAGTG